MKFLDFLNERQNIEKTRNFNVFQNYTLDSLKKVFDSSKETFNQKQHAPIRISVVGTNGKGSTSHYLACLISKLGKTVGLYTSPHLLSPLERFQIVKDGIPNLPHPNEVENCFQNEFLPNLSQYDSLSYFEYLTVFTYHFFQNQNVDVEIWEAGLGGRLDATKLVDADFVVLTKIGLDHSEILGKTKEVICKEKLGIIGEQTKALFALEEEVTSLPEAFQNFPQKDILPLHMVSSSPKESYLEFNFLYAKTILKVVFPNQKTNLELVHFQDLPKPKGRMEVLANQPLVVFDPSHNPDAIRTTALEFAKSHPKFHVLLGSLPDKDLSGILNSFLESETQLETLFLWEGNGFGRFPEPQGPLSPRVQRASTDLELVPLFQGRTPILVLGSFRLYGIVANLIQNTIKM